MTPDDFCGWLAMATPGSATVYHRGHLCRDRCRSTSALSERDRQKLTALARQALLAAEDGRVHLLQLRHGDGDYSYVAVKARASNKRPAQPRSSRAAPRPGDDQVVRPAHGAQRVLTLLPSTRAYGRCLAEVLSDA
jgi:hypothetical protein